MRAFLRSVVVTTFAVIFGSLISLVLIIGIGFGLFRSAQQSGWTPIQAKSILHLRLSGQLVEKVHPLDFNFMGPHSIFKDDPRVGLWELNRAIDAARNDKRFVGIYLDIRDFDASWAGVQELRAHLVEFAKSGKWINAYANGYDEKLYYLATAGGKIWLQPNGELELKGLGISEPFFKGLFDKLGIEAKVFRVGKFKSAIEPFILDHMSDENRQQNLTLLSDIWSEFRSATAKARGMTEAHVDELASNLSVSSAAEAKKAGLITETLFEDQAEENLAAATVGKDDEPRLVLPSQLLHELPSRRTRKGDKVALIFAEGEIGEGGGGARDAISAEEMREDIEDARRDEDVSAIVVRINSPGGDALASDVIWRELMIADEEVPVVISMGDVAASGGYYIASAGRYIFAEPTTITGSIGVFGLMFNVEKFLRDKTGVRFDRVVTHPHADIGDATRPMSASEAAVIQKSVNTVYARFLDAVQEGRGFESRSDLEAIAQGRVWSGRRAQQLGLVDDLGGLSQAILKAAEYAELGEHYRVEVFPSESAPLGRILERFSSDAMVSVTNRSGVAALSWLMPFAQRLAPLQALGLTTEALPHTGVYMRMPFDLKVQSL
jgi:protease-4